MSWVPSNDNVAVAKYEIERGDFDAQNWVLAGTVNASTTDFVVKGLTSGTTYAFRVRALDAAGNRSPASNIVRIAAN